MTAEALVMELLSTRQYIAEPADVQRLIQELKSTHAHELAEKQRAEVPRGYCPCADLIDPEVKT